MTLVRVRSSAAWRSQVAILQAAALPAAPPVCSASPRDGAAVAAWEAPTTEGWGPVHSYVVTASPGGATATVAAQWRTATVTGLSNGTAYTFTVQARNSAGSSVASSTSNSVTPQVGLTAPSLPTPTLKPPALVNPVDIFVTAANPSPVLADDTDYRIFLPRNVAFDRQGGCTIAGGRNVVLIGGEFAYSGNAGTPPTGNGALFLKGSPTQTTPRTLHVEGLLIGGYLNDGINVDSQGERNLVIQIQNCRVDTPTEGSNATNHSDAIQWFNGPADMRIDGYSAPLCGYQGFMIQPSQFGSWIQSDYKDWHFRRVNLAGVANHTDPAGAGYMVFAISGPQPQIYMDQVYVMPTANKLALGQSQYIQRPELYTPVPTTGVPSGGDFVPASAVGRGYISPTYL